MNHLCKIGKHNVDTSGQCVDCGAYVPRKIFDKSKAYDVTSIIGIHELTQDSNYDIISQALGIDEDGIIEPMIASFEDCGITRVVVDQPSGWFYIGHKDGKFSAICCNDEFVGTEEEARAYLAQAYVDLNGEYGK